MEAGPGVVESAAEKRESEHTDQTKETGRKKEERKGKKYQRTGRNEKT